MWGNALSILGRAVLDHTGAVASDEEVAQELDEVLDLRDPLERYDDVIALNLVRVMRWGVSQLVFTAIKR